MDLQALFFLSVTIAVLGFILHSVLTNNKMVGALIQLGDLQRRSEVHKEIVDSRKEVSEIPRTTKLERVSFTIGVLNACLTCYFIGAYPTKFYYWYTPKAFVLIFARWNDFRKRKQHYLLYDFCYWATLLTLMYVWVFPRNALFFQVVFLCANGPLAWSILAFNQSLVFHKWQQITSVFIHVSPMMLSYGLRWFPDPNFVICDDFPGCESVSMLTVLYHALTKFYLWWIVLYYLWIFVFLGNYLESRSFTTLYDRVAGTQMKFLFSDKDGALATSHPLIKKAVYMLTHVVFGTLTMIIACVWWKYWWAHLGFVLTICSMSTYNASKHYDVQFKFEANSPTVPVTQKQHSK